MQLFRSPLRVYAYNMLAGIVLSFVVSISGSFAADSLGYVSTDKNDLPPNLERDVSAQSVDPAQVCKKAHRGQYPG